MNYTINKEYVLEKLQALLETDSPSGYTINVMELIKSWSEELAFEFEYNKKGGGIISIPGENKDYTIGLSAHVDTLGAMVRSVTKKGDLRFTSIGGNLLPTLDGEYCRIITRKGKIYTGTILSNSPAAHVFDDAKSKERIEKNMEIRLDEKVKTKEDVYELGIGAGDFVAVDTKTIITDKGFIKSRYIDDKGGTSCILGLMEIISREMITPLCNLKIVISNFEEVGHGAAYIPKEIDELLAVDMGCIGNDLTCTEHDVSICVKDSSGPYDFNMTNKLIGLAEKNDIGHAVDIYPYYGSDVSAALRSGNNIRGALIGPGVHASHGMERTHWEGLENTIKLLFEYITN
jgi:putative aminopeptidase FrvX